MWSPIRCIATDNVKPFYFTATTTIVHILDHIAVAVAVAAPCVKYSTRTFFPRTDADSPHLYSNHILNYLPHSVDESRLQDAHIGSRQIDHFDYDSYKYSMNYSMESNVVTFNVVVVSFVALYCYRCCCTQCSIRQADESHSSANASQYVGQFACFSIFYYYYDSRWMLLYLLIPSRFFDGLAFNCLSIANTIAVIFCIPQWLRVTYRINQRHKRIFTKHTTFFFSAASTWVSSVLSLHSSSSNKRILFMAKSSSIHRTNAVHKFCKCGKTCLFAVKKLIN